MIAYRITKRRNASDLTGTGASLFPGRWNKRGTPVLYTGETKEIALLENVVHLPPSISPKLDILTLSIPDNSITEYKITDLPSNWAHFPAPTILSEMGQNWIETENTLVLRVPSSIIHTSSNLIINCRHKLFDLIQVVEHKSFYFDSRLIK